MSELEIRNRNLIAVEDITIDDFIYARSQKDLTNITVLVEKLKAGIQLDPIEVQQVSDYHGQEQVLLLINGGHRLDAYEQFNKLEDYEEVKPEFKWYKEKVLDYENSKSELAIVSHNRNDKQGLNSRPQDTKKIVRNLAKANPDWKQKDIADKLHRDPGLISHYTKDLFDKRRATKKQIAIRLSRLGWTQKSIAEVIGKAQNTVSVIINKLTTQDIDNFYNEGKSLKDIAKMFDIDIQTVWSFLLENKSDTEKIEALTEAHDGITINRDDDVWNYGKCFNLTGTKYAGRIPGQIVLNLLRWFTEQDDLVVDPMAGGGTTLDACLLLNRHCMGYDKRPSRDDIREHDITKGYPENIKKANLIFMDPPYFKKKAKDYDLSGALCTKEGFLDFAKSWVTFCKQGLREEGLVALLMSDYINYDIPKNSIFSDEYARLFENAGFLRLRKISAPLSTQQYRPDQILRAREDNELLVRGRELYILRKGMS